MERKVFLSIQNKNIKFLKKEANVCKHNFKKIAIRINIKGHNFLHSVVMSSIILISREESNIGKKSLIPNRTIGVKMYYIGL